MSESDLTAKAQRAAEWFRKSTGFDGDWDEFLGAMYFNIPEMSINEVEMVKYCQDRGWQDQDSKGVESATFNQEQEADGVEWEANQEFANVGKYLLWVLSNSNTADAFYWSVNDHNARLSSGTAPTREEARRQAVEAAREMG